MIPIFKPNLGTEELNSIKDAFDSHWIGLGPKTKEFEREFSSYIGCKNAISLNSCTAALHLSLIACGIKKGDEVLVPSITFASSAHVVLYCDAKPILVDVNKEDLLIDINDIEKKITSKTKAIIPVHYGGSPCEMDDILKIARQNNLYVIEDAANCTGAIYKNKKIGNLDSDFTCFSFEAKKNLTTGDGGMITTNKKEHVEKIRTLRWVGMDKDTHKRFSKENKPWDYDIIDLGYKYNMNDIQAAIGLSQLKKLDMMNEKRRKIAKRYNESLKKIPWIQIPAERDYAKSVYWLYTIRLENTSRDKFMEYIMEKGILTNTNFKPLQFFSFYREYFKKEKIKVHCPVAENEWKKLVVLPLYPDMSYEEFDKIVKTIKGFSYSK